MKKSYIFSFTPELFFVILIACFPISAIPWNSVLAGTPNTLGSTTDTVRFQARPNILLIIVDDGRFDSYSCNGGPSFFQSPNIDRIANEGVNFVNNYCTDSYCIPSRGSIVTGLYPHKNGAVDNGSNIYPNLPTTATILDSAGYYTAWIGKYHMAVDPQRGYQYWFATKINSGTDEYNNMKYDYNGVLKRIQGHDTDILTDTMLAFLDRNGHKNFFATLAYHAPHAPYIPQPAFDGIFKDDTMPVPSDTERYQKNYPSFLDSLGKPYYIAPVDISPTYEPYYELLAGVDAGVGEVLNKLTDLGILDNTLIIFTSDNGFILGEHGLFTKRLAYDPSMRVPLFIRYPAWFADSTIITNQMALNIDIAPTILDAAGINGNYSFDGVSVKKLADGSATRTSMYYEYLTGGEIKDIPDMRSVRTMNTKFVDYSCDEVTQEFFDLTRDPDEINNRINDPNYTATIQNLRSQLSAYQAEFIDTGKKAVSICYLANAIVDGIDEESFPMLEDNILLFPVPAKNQVTIAFTSANEDSHASLVISNVFGTMVQRQAIYVNHGDNIHSISLNKELGNGYYLITLTAKDGTISKSFVIEK